MVMSACAHLTRACNKAQKRFSQASAEVDDCAEQLYLCTSEWYVYVCNMSAPAEFGCCVWARGLCMMQIVSFQCRMTLACGDILHVKPELLPLLLPPPPLWHCTVDQCALPFSLHVQDKQF